MVAHRKNEEKRPEARRQLTLTRNDQPITIRSADASAVESAAPTSDGASKPAAPRPIALPSGTPGLACARAARATAASSPPAAAIHLRRLGLFMIDLLEGVPAEQHSPAADATGIGRDLGAREQVQRDVRPEPIALLLVQSVRELDADLGR